MITKFKIFEYANEINFKVGDYVYPVHLYKKTDTKYKIIKIVSHKSNAESVQQSNNPYDFCDIEVNGNIIKNIWVKSIISEEEYERRKENLRLAKEKVKLRKDLDKYNL